MLLVSDWIVSLRGSDLLVPLPPQPVVGLIGIGMTLAALTRCRTIRRWGLTLPAPVFLAGIMLCVAALGLWSAHERPIVLISEAGDAVGIMSPVGRVVSKPSGGAFAISNWLADDGDLADQSRAAARKGWDGPRNLRESHIALGNASVRILHGTGRFDPDAVSDACHTGTIIIIDKEFAHKPDVDPRCLILDQSVLRREGAMAIIAAPKGPRLVSVASQSGQRPWAPGRHRPVDLQAAIKQ